MSDRAFNWRMGNILGAARAEADKAMLSEAFVETSDFQALRNTDHFNFVVGRRGTGKTALFLRCVDEFQRDRKIFAHMLKPEEYDSLGLLGMLSTLRISDYREVRAITRVLWRGSILLSVAHDLCSHWKYRTSSAVQWLQQYTNEWRNLLALNELQRCTYLLKQFPTTNSLPTELPGLIATKLKINTLEEEVRQGLDALGKRALFLFDGLDEGLLPNPSSTGVLGGLAITVADFKDHDLAIHGELFIRDNIFRSLAALDSDFSRHIEGSTLRLNWTEESLLNFIANRLRVVLEMRNVENSQRVWNRFAHRELKERQGFRSCLQHTLYRPRDLLVLLNQAAVQAARSGRSEIVQEDIDNTSKQISQDRYADLLKEYETVFPGLGYITDSFQGGAAFQTIAAARARLATLLEDGSYATPQTSDLAILGTNSQLMDALYSVGFLGLEDGATKAVSFCHDGARASISGIEDNRRIAIHPCYWKALDLSSTGVDTEVLVEIHDDYETRVNPQLSDIRTKRLGQLVAELPGTPKGRDGAQEYEKWVLQACRILFAGELSNFDLHPAPDGVQRRDVVATNAAERGFWKRLLDDYAVRQVIFETKNYDELDPDDYRQALSYSGRQYGQLVILVVRSEADGLDTKARGWVKEIWDLHNVLLFVLPTRTLIQCLSKTRSTKGRSYTERALMKRLDTFERSYLALRHQQTRRRRKKT